LLRKIGFYEDVEADKLQNQRNDKELVDYLDGPLKGLRDESINSGMSLVAGEVGLPSLGFQIGISR
jgi:hypothetical protein